MQIFNSCFVTCLLSLLFLLIDFSLFSGVAACFIGGSTLHSFGGFGNGCGTKEQCAELVLNNNARIQWKRCQHLIIDEISMIDADYFEKLEYVGFHDFMILVLLNNFLLRIVFRLSFQTCQQYNYFERVSRKLGFLGCPKG